MFPLLGSLVAAAFLLAGCSPANSASHPDDTSGADHAASLTCTAKAGVHAHGEEGTLTPRYDETGHHIGWSCSFGGSHHTCTSGPSGREWECMFPPDVHPFPEPLSPDVARHPPPPSL